VIVTSSARITGQTVPALGADVVPHYFFLIQPLVTKYESTEHNTMIHAVFAIY